MTAYKTYKHIIANNVFGITDKIKELRKNPRYVNKNRKAKN
jgi:hypothetical protein|tara:strand:+ start:830 stop:952 length:123 start_codon:yes stop_codon:yes gene_type:complete